MLAKDGSKQLYGTEKELARKELTEDHFNCDEIVDICHPQNDSNTPFKRNSEGGKPHHIMVFKERCAEKTGNWRKASNMSSVPSLTSSESGMHKLLPGTSVAEGPHSF